MSGSKLGDTQVSKEHYVNGHYDTLARFVGYYLQKELILEVIQRQTETAFNILEVGPGNGLVTDYLRKQEINLTTIDIADDLHPDIIGDIRQLSTVVRSDYDMICCFEVLEHIPYENLDKVITEFSKVTKRYLVISVPQVKLYFTIWSKVSITKPICAYLSVPFPKKHVFDGQHYWELGARGYSEKRFVTLLEKKFTLSKKFTHPLDPYHKYYLWEKK